MARKNTTKTAKASAATLDLATAKTADGALTTPRTAYEICGIKNASYRAKSFAEYQRQLRAMDIWQLQDHAYAYAVAPSASKEVMIQRLETKFLRENPQAREEYSKVKAAGHVDEDKLTVQERAQRILSYGR